MWLHHCLSGTYKTSAYLVNQERMGTIGWARQHSSWLCKVNQLLTRLPPLLVRPLSEHVLWPPNPTRSRDGIGGAQGVESELQHIPQKRQGCGKDLDGCAPPWISWSPPLYHVWLLKYWYSFHWSRVKILGKSPIHNTRVQNVTRAQLRLWAAISVRLFWLSSY